MRPQLADTARRAAVHPLVVDATIALAVLGVGVIDLSDGSGGGPQPGPGLAVLLAGGAAALLARRVAPLGVWATTSAITAGLVLLDGTDPTLTAPPAAMLVALYTVARSEGLRTTVVCALTSGALYTVVLNTAQGLWLEERGDSLELPVLALVGAAAALGVAIRGQQDAAQEAARARARQAELTREEEAVRRVTDERLRIARELHDAVAHHISVINVQAGVARHLMDTRPDQARTALTAVRDASKTVLKDMTAILGLLRTEDGVTPAEPAPGLHRLPALIASLRSAGLDVDSRTTGPVRELPPIADLTAYRVIQESLTNALKYGTGTADLLVHHDPSEIVIEVCNPVADTTAPETGGRHGLMGMRERLDAVDGSLAAGPHGDGGWLVRAVVPRGPA